MQTKRPAGRFAPEALESWTARQIQREIEKNEAGIAYWRQLRDNAATDHYRVRCMRRIDAFQNRIKVLAQLPQYAPVLPMPLPRHARPKTDMPPLTK